MKEARCLDGSIARLESKTENLRKLQSWIQELEKKDDTAIVVENDDDSGRIYVMVGADEPYEEMEKIHSLHTDLIDGDCSNKGDITYNYEKKRYKVDRHFRTE